MIWGHVMRKIFWFVILSLSLSGITWAACEEAADVFDRAQRTLTSAQSALNAASQRSFQKADDDRRVVDDRDDIISKRSVLENDPDYLMAQQEKLSAWKAWREAKEALALCVEKQKESAW